MTTTSVFCKVWMHMHFCSTGIIGPAYEVPNHLSNGDVLSATLSCMFRKEQKDSIASHHHFWERTRFLIWRHELGKLVISSCAVFVCRWVTLDQLRKKILHHDCASMLQTRFVPFIEHVLIRRYSSTKNLR